MGPHAGVEAALSADWLGASRAAARAARAVLAGFPDLAERSRETGRGEGGDMTLAIDRAVEDAVLAELDEFGVGATVVTEERGRLEVAGGGPAVVVVDPIDGSLNAKRGLRPYSLSIAVAGGGTMADVAFGYVTDLSSEDEWWAERGNGAFFGGDRLAPAHDAELEILGVESARPELVADAGEARHAGHQPQLLAERESLRARPEPQRGAGAIGGRQHGAPGQEDAAQLLGKALREPPRAARLVGDEVAVEGVVPERSREDLGQALDVALARRADLELRHDPGMRAHRSHNDAEGRN